MDNNSQPQFQGSTIPRKLYLCRGNPLLEFNHEDALNLYDHLVVQKALIQEPSQQPIVLHAREEAGCIVITFGNDYSMNWAAIDMELTGSYQSILHDEFIVCKVKPTYLASMPFPSVEIPGFSEQTISDIVHEKNRPHFNAVSTWGFERVGQKLNISFGTSSVRQLIQNQFMLSLGSLKVPVELIGFNGKIYGQAGDFKAVFSSLDHPFVMLDKEDAHKLNYHLHDKKQKIPQNDRKPVIESFAVKNGYIVVECLNQFSLEWVVENAQDQEMKRVIMVGAVEGENDHQ